MTNMNQRDRIARALANTDVSGPEDFDTADEMERRMYYRMALAALNHAHLYAIHTHRGVLSSSVLSSITSPFTLTMTGGSYRRWGEEAKEGEPLHVVIGLDDTDAVRDLALTLGAAGVPFDVTRYSAWDDEDYGEPAYTEEALGLPLHMNWSAWKKAMYGHEY